MANEENSEQPHPSFPRGRIKNIMKLDREINKINSEALSLVSRSAELFLQFLAEKCAEVAAEKKRKTVKLEHLRIAVERHRPTSDFLLDSLPSPPPPSDCAQADRARPRAAAEKPVPAGTRRIDDFFSKSAAANEAPKGANSS
ncbi:uncharacterized protein LOC131144745 [Malania oleifera]|uniref:uncharacterized protein LOC131144745 n=1 Tax=Malania oleifera TaxID=397392 RepID=UPI0025ADF70B|nr:uncharacterized protein LOC131144745 [Malania oleifera]